MNTNRIAATLRKARPMTTPGTFAPSRADAVRNQYVAWRYTVTMFGDMLDKEAFSAGETFDRKAFNADCGVES